MSDVNRNASPRWFAVVAVLALVWNVLGLLAFIMHMMTSPETLAEMPPPERALMEATPTWVTVAFAVAVICGTAGSLLLVLRNHLAGIFLQLSLVGVLVQNIYTWFMSEAPAVYGAGAVFMSLLVIAIAIYLVVLAARARRRGWTH